MRIIFLDIDGVLNSEESLNYHLKENNHEIMYDAPYIKHVKNLEYIIRETGAKLVFTSTWRNSWHLFNMQMLLTILCPKCDFNFVGLTPRFIGKERGEEIKFWLELVKKDETKFQDRTHEDKKSFMSGYSWRSDKSVPYVFNVESFVVLDDDPDMTDVKDNFVHVNNKKGLTLEDAKRAIEILKGASE